MTFGYKINRSDNTLFKVWGILVLIFGSITALFALIGLLILCVGTSSDAVRFLSSINDEVKMSVVWGYVIYISYCLILLTVKFSTGVILVKENFKSKWKFIFYAVLYFLSAMGYLLIMFLYLVGVSMVKRYVKVESGELVVSIIIWVIKIVWDILTGVFLIMKQVRLAPVSFEVPQPNPFPTPEPSPFPQPGPFPPIPGPEPNPFPPTPPQPNPFPPAPPQPILPPSPPFPSDYTIPNTSVVGTIVGLFGVFQGQTFELHSGEVCRIGRESVCDIQIKHPKVSRIHCTVCRLSDGMYQITDTSTNGTFYNNKRLEKNVPTKVPPGGTLVVGEADNVLQLNVN